MIREALARHPRKARSFEPVGDARSSCVSSSRPHSPRNGQALKERTIGVEVFGRATSYDPGNDSTVRVKAGEVRKRLQTYYSGTARPARSASTYQRAGYLPEFHHAPQAAIAAVAPPANHFSRWPWLLLAACALFGTFPLALTFWPPGATPSAAPDNSRSFWGSELSSSNPILLWRSYTPVYGLNPRLEAAGAPRPTHVQDFDLLSETVCGRRRHCWRPRR